MRSRTRLGIGISTDTVRVVLVSGIKIRWTQEKRIADGRSMEDSLAELLLQAPVRHFPKPRAFVALGPSAAWVKRLTDVPALATSSLTTQAIRANAERFFPHGSDPQMIAAAFVDKAAGVWAASVYEARVEAVQFACRSAGLRAVSFAPTTMMIGLLLPRSNDGRVVVWQDGTIEATIQVASNGWPLSIAHERLTGDNQAPNPLPSHPNDELSALGTNAFAFADAYGAALLGRNAPLSFEPSAMSEQADGEPLRSRRLAVFACAASVVAALAAPVLMPTHRRAQDEARIAAISVAAMASSAAEAELGKQSIAVRSADQFYSASPSPTLLLHSLTLSLPDGIAIVSFRFDSAGGSLFLIGDGVIRALEAVDSLPEIAAAQVVTPVTRETLNGREVERLALRFAFRRARKGDDVGIIGRARTGAL